MKTNAYRGYLIHENVLNNAYWITKNDIVIAHCGGFSESKAEIDLLLDEDVIETMKANEYEFDIDGRIR
jgi:hypothetical protein